MTSTDQILTTCEAAALLKVHPQTLITWRHLKRGPPYRQLPGSDSIRYSRNDVMEWSAIGRVAPRARTHRPLSSQKQGV